MATDSPDLTVAPSDIRSFGLVLDDLTTLLTELRSEVLAARSVDFGEYAKSAEATSRYHRAVDQRAQALQHLATTAERFTDGTAQLAREYDDVSALNAARAQEVSNLLGEGSR